MSFRFDGSSPPRVVMALDARLDFGFDALRLGGRLDYIVFKFYTMDDFPSWSRVDCDQVFGDDHGL